MFKLAKTSLLVAAATLSLSASDILVSVNGKNITKQDAEQFVAASTKKTTYGQLNDMQKEAIKQRLIEKVLFTELAKKEGIEKTPDFKNTLEKIKEELLVNVWMKKQLDNTIVSDSEAKEFYDKNADKFLKPEMVHARHILVKEEKEAEEIIKSLAALKGDKLKEKFIELAKTKSVGPSKSKGGDLGEFRKGQMVPEFSKAVWALEKSTITTKPVKTQFGYHVIYLEDKIKEQKVPYTEVKEKIVMSLKQKQFASKVKAMSQELKSKAKIVDHSKKKESVDTKTETTKK